MEKIMSKANDAINAGERKIEMNEQVRELTKDELNSVSGGRITNVRANASGISAGPAGSPGLATVQ